MRDCRKFLQNVRENGQAKKHIDDSKNAFFIRLWGQIAIADSSQGDAHEVARHNYSIANIFEQLIIVVH